MKHIFIFLLFVFGLTACSTGPRHEIEIQMDCSLVIKELRRANNVEVIEVLEATYAMENKGAKDFISLFLKTAKRIHPNKPFREYFKRFKGVGPGATDAQVRKGLYQYRSRLIADLKNQLTEELNEFGLESMDVVKGKDVLKVVCDRVPDVNALRMKFSKSNFLRIYEVATRGELLGISTDFVANERVAAEPEIDSASLNEIAEVEIDLQAPLGQLVYGKFGVSIKKDDLQGYLNRMNAISQNVLFIPSIKEINHQGELYSEVYPCLIPTNRSTLITDRDLKSAVVEFDQQMNAHQVLITLTEKGAVKFGKLSGENVGEVLAIAINDRAVFSAPVVNGQIEGGKIFLSGTFTKKEAEDLVHGLNVKNWRVPCSIIALKKIK